MEPTEAELSAIQLRYRAQHPGAPENANPTAAEAAILLQEIREREELIEAEAVKMLLQATRNQPSRSGMNSKYMQFFVFYALPSVFAVLAVVGLALWVWSLVFGH